VTLGLRPLRGAALRRFILKRTPHYYASSMRRTVRTLVPVLVPRRTQAALPQGPSRRCRLGRLATIRKLPVVAHLDSLLEATLFLPRMSTKEQKERIELLQGTLDLLILRTLLLSPTHGHAIAKAIECNSDDVLQVEQGSLYPALHRLIKRGWISSEDGTSENNRGAKFYRLTARGRRQLAVETSKRERLAGAIARILRPVGQEGKS
jgi:PadR family transcriptional regulator, regulatory protein PadR